MANKPKGGMSKKAKYLAVSLAALIAVGGFAAVSMANASSQLGASSSAGTQSTQSTYNGEYLEIVAWTWSGSQKVPVADANVTVYTITHSVAANGTITITLTPFETNMTNAHGAAYFNLPNGKYAISVYLNGARGFAVLDLRYYRTVFVELR